MVSTGASYNNLRVRNKQNQQINLYTVFDLFNAPGGVTFSKRGAITRVNIYCIKQTFIFIK